MSNIMSIFETAMLVCVMTSFFALMIFVIMWYRNKKIEVTIRKMANWSFPFIFGIVLFPLIAFEKDDYLPNGIIIAFSAVLVLYFTIMLFLMYSGKIKSIVEDEKNGKILIAPRFENPSKAQKEMEEYVHSLSKEEYDAWYKNYCENNKYLNPYIAAFITIASYLAELYFWLKT